MTRRPGRFFLLVLGLAILLAVFERAAVALRARFDEAGRGACWIWADGVLDLGQPVAFYAVRDVKLDAPPARAGEWVITADESYVAYLNGRPLGAGTYVQGAPADLYDVTDLLETGWNRLAVELASRRGAGGLLSSLWIDGRAALVTDGSWRVYRQYEVGLLRGWPLSGGEDARVWERHPTGRWRLAPPVPHATLPLTAPETDRALRLRMPWDPDNWFELDGTRAIPEEFGAQIVLDWGREVTGLLSLELARTDGTPGFFHVGAEIPDSTKPAHGLVIPVPGRAWWVDVRPRTFRYLLLTGVELASPPEVWHVAPSWAPAGPEKTGVFGIVPPRDHSLAEETIRGRIRLPDLE